MTAGLPKVKETQQKLDQLMKRMSQLGDFPSITKHINEINKKASPKSLSSAIELAELILKDYSLTSKLLKLVNSAFYGQFSGQITTVSRAVVILGFEQVRMAASGLLFIQHMQNKAQANELEIAIVTSFMSGILARDLSSTLKMQDTEELFVCSMFHNLGKLLTIYYFPDEYDTFLKLNNEDDLDEDSASQKALGITFKELGMEVGRLWNLPKIIISCMPGIATGDKNKKQTREYTYQCLSSFANELCEIAIQDSSPEKINALQALLRKYKHIFPFSEKRIAGLMDSATEKIREFSGVLKLKKQQAKLIKSMSFRTPQEVQKRDSGAVPEKTGPPDLNLHLVPETQTPQSTSMTLNEKQMLLVNGIQEITTALLEENNDLDDVLTMVTKTIYEGMGFSHVLICIKDPKTNVMTARFGLGQYIDEVIRKFKFTVSDEQDFFNLSLEEGKDIYIENTRDPSVRAGIPDWYKGILMAHTFVLYPIVVKNVGIGILYAGIKNTGDPIDLDQLKYLKTLRNQVVLAITGKA